MFGFSLMEIIAGLPGLIIAMVIHEYAHARTAVALGDFTPKMMGRLTLNPMAHIDPLGLVMLLLVRFGWAKPVMINPNNFRQPRRDDVLVSLAGPGANLVMAFLALVVLLLCYQAGVVSPGSKLVLQLIVEYNIGFAIFNLIPIPPLDGSHILMQLLPYDMQQKLMGLERYSMLILIVLLMTPVLSYIFVPARNLIYQVFFAILRSFF